MPSRLSAACVVTCLVVPLGCASAGGPPARGTSAAGAPTDIASTGGAAAGDATAVAATIAGVPMLPAPDDERGALFGQPLGESRETVLAALAGHAPSPACTFSRLVPDGARRTFPMERCEHATGSVDPVPVLAERSVERVTTWFVDDRLVRIDAALAPDVGARSADDALRERLVDRLGTPDDEPPSTTAPATPDEGGADEVPAILGARAAGTTSTSWSIGPDRLRLDEDDGPGASARLSVIDARVADAFPELGTDAVLAPANDGGDLVR